MAIRILANENLPGEAVEAMRLDGHDVVWISIDGGFSFVFANQIGYEARLC